MNKTTREALLDLLAWVVGALAIAVLFSGCTDNSRARKWGGSVSKTLACNQKLVTVTWKENDLWVLTRPMQPGETAVTSLFQERSKYGVMEGQIELIESICP